jgi:hypothetical protein
VITLIGFLAALAALITGIATLHDTHITAADRQRWRESVRSAWRAMRSDGVLPSDLARLQEPVREILRGLVLILIVASSGVAMLEAIAGPELGAYDVLLRCALAAYMAMQAPCPWLHFVTRGDRRQAPRPLAAGDTRHVQ